VDDKSLRQIFNKVISEEAILGQSRSLGLIQRERKLDIVRLVRSMVLGAGSDDSGRLSDAMSYYLQEKPGDRVVRGIFYGWMTDDFADLMRFVAARALDEVRALPPTLSDKLRGVKDWHVVDSETVSLRPPLGGTFPATSTSAGLKIHKRYSLGRGNIIGYDISPARDHDAPHLVLDESWRGLGLIVDLGYASLKLIRDSQEHGVELVMRLKSNWKPRLLRTVLDGEVRDALGEPELVGLLEAAADEANRSVADLDVAFGKGTDRVVVRLVGVPGKDKYHWCLTTLSRETHPPELIAELYRTRWEIELDNRRDKGAARLDQIRATTESSVMALVHASLIRTLLANWLVYEDIKERPATRAPLHAFAVALAIAALSQHVQDALANDRPDQWKALAIGIRARGHDPNWRRRPSPLDVLRGITAPPGRAKHSKLSDCPPEARSYSQQGL
jgi:hypothetical protein